MTTKRMILAAILAEAAAALATVKPTKAACGIICVDKINKCGQRYGGCYDPCVESAPTPPPCVTPVLNTWYPTPVPTTTVGEVANCSTITVCVDGINSCGIPFGACIPDCKPWHLVTPPCPSDILETIPWSPATPTDSPDLVDFTEAPEAEALEPTEVPVAEAPGPTVKPQAEALEPTEIPQEIAAPVETEAAKAAEVAERNGFFRWLLK